MSTGSGSSPSAKCSLCGQPSGSQHVCSNPLSKFLGTQIDGRYTVDGVLGKGGMGVVFGGLQTSVHRRVAIKMLHPSLASTPEFFERFRREAELASRLHHPNIITVFDFGRTADGGCYYVMELVQGESLRALVRREGPMTIARAVRIIEQVGRALAAAHDAGVVHRDLKPHNVMCTAVDGGDFCKVLDFGLVKALEDEDHEAEQLTTTGQVLGTPSYMAPEQASGDPLDQRADLYALGACLYFCLTGSPPCKTNSAHKALAMMMNGEIPAVGTRRIGAPVPEKLEVFLKRALAFSPDERPQTAEQFITEMKEAIAGVPQTVLEARPEGAAVEPPESGTSASRLSRAAKAAKAKPGAKAKGSQVSRPARSRGGLIAIAAVAIVACGALGFGAKALLTPARVPSPVTATPDLAAKPKPDPTGPVAVQPTPPEPHAKSVSVHVETTPPGAQIFKGEELLGITPADLLLKREPVNLTLKRDGYQAVTKGIDLGETPAGETAQVKLELVAQQAAKPGEPTKTPGKQPTKKGPDIPTFDD